MLYSSCLRAILQLRIAIFFLVISRAFAATDAPPNIGNFSLPNAQQPGPFYSFGQNIVDKYTTQIFLSPTYTNSVGDSNLGLNPNLLYGLTDNSSLLFMVPITLKNNLEDHHVSGIGDVGIQGEYAFYNSSSSSYTGQATILGNFTLPSGSTNTDPALGSGVPTYFLGATYNLTTINWMWFSSLGTTFSHQYKNERSGAQYLYQAGVGKVFNSKSNEYIFLGLLELDGQYNNTNTMFTHKIPNSGGNIIYATPSLWFSTQKLILQWGFSIPIIQVWNGNQPRKNYNTSFLFGWTF